jgi:X breakpoint 2-interacting protein
LLGLASPCSNDPDSGTQGNSLDVIALVNTCSKLIQNLRACTKTILELETRLQRLHNDVDRAEEVSTRQREALEIGRRQAAEAAERERQSGMKLQEERDRLKMTKDENRRLTNALVQRDSQYGHELKRRDQELNKLRERLVRLLTSSKSSKTIRTQQGSIELSAMVSQPEGRTRGKWRRRDDSEGVFEAYFITFKGPLSMKVLYFSAQWTPPSPKRL